MSDQPIVFAARTIEWGSPIHEWDEPIPAARDPIVGEFRDRSLSGTVFAPDAAQNFIVGWGFNLAHSNRGGASFVRKDRTGAVTGAWTINTPDDQKPDDMGGGQTGADLAMVVLTHEAISEDTRRNRVYLGLLTDVLVAYAAGQPALGGYVPRAALQGGEPPPAPQPSEPVDYTRIQQIAGAEVDRLISNFAGGDPAGRVRRGLQEKVMDGLRDAIKKENRGDPRAAAYQDALAEFARDRAYEGCLAALEAGGVLPAGTVARLLPTGDNPA